MPNPVAAHLVLEMMVCFFIWLPFALAALILEEWGAPMARRWRTNVVHPVRAVRAYRLAHAH